ncbi:MAG: YitT family protein, partial [Phycisphaerales bacterium]
MGETECEVKIPKDSDLIQDHKIAFRFCLPDGQERTKVVDLHGLKPSNPLAEFVAAPFMLAGGGVLLVAAASDDDEDEDFSSSHHKEKDKNTGDRLVAGLAGVGVMGIGAGLYYLCGGKTGGMDVHEVHMDFNEPAGEQESQTSSAPSSEQADSQ